MFGDFLTTLTCLSDNIVQLCCSFTGCFLHDECASDGMRRFDLGKLFGFEGVVATSGFAEGVDWLFLVQGIRGESG